MPERPSATPDWRRDVARRAKAAGIDLPTGTVDELALHLDDLYTAARADGASDAVAREHALRALDESTWSALGRHASRDPRRSYTRAANEAARVAQGRSFSVVSALRTAIRQFRQHPSFALVTVLVLGLGTGAATTVFTVVDAVVLRPLPYAAPDRLVTLWDTNTEKGLAHDPISPVNFMDYRALPVFSDAAAWWRPGVNLVDPGKDPARVNTIEVGGNIFDVLGVRPQVGAGFPEKGPMFVQNELVAVISDRLWRTRYGADPSIIGRQLSLNTAPYTIVGVMPPKFHYPDDVDVWQRLRWDLTQHSRAAHFMEAVARLSDGTTFEQAQSAVDGARAAPAIRVRAHQQGLGIAAHPAPRRTARLLPPRADGPLRRRRPAAGDRLSERRIAAADARAVARSRDCRAHRDGRVAATARHATARRKSRPLGGRGRSRHPRRGGVAAAHPRAHANRHSAPRRGQRRRSRARARCRRRRGDDDLLRAGAGAAAVEDAARPPSSSRANVAARVARAGSTRCWSPARLRSRARCSSARRC